MYYLSFTSSIYFISFKFMRLCRFQTWPACLEIELFNQSAQIRQLTRALKLTKLSAFLFNLCRQNWWTLLQYYVQFKIQTNALEAIFQREDNLILNSLERKLMQSDVCRKFFMFKSFVIIQLLEQEIAEQVQETPISKGCVIALR